MGGWGGWCCWSRGARADLGAWCRSDLVGGAGGGWGAGLVGLALVLTVSKCLSRTQTHCTSSAEDRVPHPLGMALVMLPASPSILRVASSKPKAMIYSLCFQWKEDDLQRAQKVKLDGNPKVWPSHSGACLWEALPQGTGVLGRSQPLLSMLEFPGHRKLVLPRDLPVCSSFCEASGTFEAMSCAGTTRAILA